MAVEVADVVSRVRPPWYRDVRVMRWVFQLAVLALVAFGLWRLYGNATSNLRSSGLPTGFDFLDRKSRFAIPGLQDSAQFTISEAFVAGYLNTLQTTIDTGIGVTVAGARDVRATYAAEVELARDTGALVDRMNLLLANGRMSSASRSRIVEAVNAISVPTTGTPATINTTLVNRVKLAAYMTMASSEYLVQR